MKTGKKVLSLLLALMLVLGSVACAGVVSFAAATETEGNDTYDKANTLNDGTAMEGTLTAKSDNDWFTFTAKANGTVSVAFAHTKSASTDTYFNVSVYSAANAATHTSAAATLESKGSDESKSTSFTAVKDTVYYIWVRTANDSAVNVKYSLTVSGFGTTTGDVTVPTGADKESGDNGDFSKANTLTVGKLMVGNLSESTDVDFFAFAADGDSMLNIDFTHAVADGIGVCFYVTVYNLAKQEIGSMSVSGGQAATTLKNIEIEMGTYFIVVQKGFTYSNMQYEIGVSLTAPPTFTEEKEDNNTIAEANVLKVNKPMVGKFDSLTDTVDYFTYTTTAKSVVDISLSHDESKLSNAGYVYFYVFLYNSLGQQIASAESKGSDGTVSLPKKMYEAGTYYVAVSKGAVVTDLQYSLNVSVLTYSGSEVESNDTYGESTVIKTGSTSDVQAYLGDLKDATDIDFFKFNIPARGYIYLDFTNFSTDSTTAYTVSLCKLSSGSGELKLQTLKSFQVACDEDGRTTGSVGLPAGDYYLKVTGADVDGGAYLVAVRYTQWDKYEMEVNDTQEAYNSTVGGLMYGSSFDADDKDWFGFKYDSKKTYTVSAERSYTTAEKTSGVTDTTSAKWVVQVYISGANDGKPVDSFTFTNAKDGAGSKTLGEYSDGICYLCVKSIGDEVSTKDYKITVTATQNKNNMSIMEKLADLKSRFDGIDWSNLAEQFSFMKQFVNLNTLVTFGKALAGLFSFIGKLFN